jgi:hypothetical protein
VLDVSAIYVKKMLPFWKSLEREVLWLLFGMIHPFCRTVSFFDLIVKKATTFDKSPIYSVKVALPLESAEKPRQLDKTLA